MWVPRVRIMKVCNCGCKKFAQDKMKSVGFHVIPHKDKIVNPKKRFH